MINKFLKKKIIILLAHLDDEFALIPLIKKISNNKDIDLKFIYCAERNNFEKLKRRKENLKFLRSFRINASKVIYLNDYFLIDDLNLYKKSSEIYRYLKGEYFKNKFDLIISLDFEGGNPDHDALALISEKFCNKYRLKKYYFPAYNYSGKLFNPINVLCPKETEKNFYKKFKTEKKDWLDLIKIIFIYKTEFLAFIKLLPFFILKILFSNELYYRNSLRPIRINWELTLSKIIYKVEIKDILERIDSI